MDVCLTIIRNNQFSSRARTVKDYLSFILAVTIGQFRSEEGILISVNENWGILRFLTIDSD